MRRRLTHRRWVRSTLRMPVAIFDAWHEASQIAGCSQSRFRRDALKRHATRVIRDARKTERDEALSA